MPSNPIHFILLVIPERRVILEEYFAEIMDLAADYGAETTPSGDSVLLTFGLDEPADITPEELRQFRAELNKLQPPLKILYGSAKGNAGFVPGKVPRHIFVLPHLSDARQAVQQLDWGQMAEFVPK